MSPIILIDGDIRVYATAFGVETPIYVCKGGVYKTKAGATKASEANGFPVSKRINIGSEQALRKHFDAKLKHMFDDCGSTSYEMYITASKVEGNFRSKIAKILPYKGNRTKSVKPYHYNTLRKIMIEE